MHELIKDEERKQQQLDEEARAMGWKGESEEELAKKIAQADKELEKLQRRASKRQSRRKPRRS